MILQKLNSNRYANKIKFKYIVGDFNQGLIKHDDDIDRQNLIESARNHGFAQLVLLLVLVKLNLNARRRKEGTWTSSFKNFVKYLIALHNAHKNKKIVHCLSQDKLK